MSAPGYELTVGADWLLLKTAHYKVEKGSILHSGIYNREMSSSLASSAVAGAFLIAFAATTGAGALHFAIAAVLFVGGVVFFRMTVFKENPLAVSVSKADGKVTIKYPGVFFGHTESFATEEVEKLAVELTTITPENPDGIKVVKKIALQHGTVIPGFGEELELHSVSFVLKDGTKKTVFASKDAEAADTLYERLREFTGIA